MTRSEMIAIVITEGYASSMPAGIEDLWDNFDSKEKAQFAGLRDFRSAVRRVEKRVPAAIIAAVSAEVPCPEFEANVGGDWDPMELPVNASEVPAWIALRNWVVANAE